MPRRKSVIDAVIQQLSPVLGSTTVVAVADLDLDGVDTVVLVTVVVDLVVAAAGFSEGFAVGPVVGSAAAGLVSAGDLSAPPPGTSTPSVSPAGGVAGIVMGHDRRMGVRDADILAMQIIDIMGNEIDAFRHIGARDRDIDHGHTV